MVERNNYNEEFLTEMTNKYSNIEMNLLSIQEFTNILHSDDFLKSPSFSENWRQFKPIIQKKLINILVELPANVETLTLAGIQVSREVQTQEGEITEVWDTTRLTQFHTELKDTIQSYLSNT